MSNVSVIIPFRDELEILSKTHESTCALLELGWEIIWVNDGSKDNGEQLLAKKIGVNEKLIHSEGIGILRAFLFGSSASTREVQVWLPADCELQVGDFSPQLLNQLVRGIIWGAFPKEYDLAAMKTYSFLQNKFLLCFGMVVWTNVFVLPKALLSRLDEINFPQDLSLSRVLRERAEFRVLPGRAIVSARKYCFDGIVGRIFQNGCILILYLLGLKGDKLHTLYRQSIFKMTVWKGSLLFLLAWAAISAYASTTQRRPPPQRRSYSTPAPTRSSTPRPSSGSSTEKPRKSVYYAPVKKNIESAREWIYDVPRRNISIHSIESEGSEIRIEGAFTDESGLESFAVRLSGDGRRKFRVEKKTYYRLGLNKDYVIFLENQW